MKSQLNTIREFFNAAYTTGWPRREDAAAVREALAELETMAGEQKPVAWLIESEGDSLLVRQTPYFPGIFAGNQFRKTPLFLGAAPVAQQPQAEAVPSTHVLVPVELLYRVLDSEEVNTMADASDELRAMLAAAQKGQP